jgi:hypothetical protein
MKNNWNKILNELSYRVSSGIPDLTNEQHLMKLWDILKEHNWNIDARVELLKNLDEAKKVTRHPGTTWVTASGHAGKRPDGKSQYGMKSKDVAKAYVAGQDVDSKTDPEDVKSTGKEKEEPQEREPQDENTPEQNRQKDIELVETQLFMFDGDPQEKGGAGTPESRTGECVTTYAGRRIKELMPPNGKMSYEDAREKVRQELLKQANATNEEGKKSLLTEEWVESGLRCLDWINENIGLDKVEDFAWDTPEGNELVGAKGHGTSADMFIKTTDGKVIGISLKKDFKVFVYNGGYDKNIKKFAEDMGFDLQDLPPELMYEGNENAYKERKQKIFDESIEKFNDEEVKKKVCANFERAKKGGDDYKKVFGSRTATKMSRLKQVAKKSGKKDIQSLTCDDLYDNIINAKSHTGDMKKVIFGLAQHDPEIEQGVGNLYTESRAQDMKQRDSLYDFITEEKNSETFKKMVSHHTHIDDVLFGTTGDQLDRLEVVYGEPPKGESMKKKALVAMFGIGDDYEKWENEKDPKKKKELQKQLQEKIRERMVITKESGQPVIGVKIENPSPPPPESISPIFTLSVRAKGITAAPAMEMGQTVFGGLAYKNGNVDVKTWSPEDRKTYIEAEAANTLNDIEAEDVDFVSEKGKKEVNDRIKKLEKLKESLGDEIKFTDKSKINKAIASLKRGLKEN